MDRSNKYTYPRTLEGCYKALDNYAHTNSSQATHISTLQSRLHSAELVNQKQSCELMITTAKFNNLLADWKALRDQLAMLSRIEVRDYLTVEAWDKKDQPRF